VGKFHVVCDFDGTLATSFVGGEMFRGYAPADRVAEIRNRFVSNEISLRKYQEEVFDLVGQSTAEMAERAVATASIRPLAKELFAAIWNGGGTVTVASAGLDFYIGPVLKNAGLERVELVSGKVVSDPAELPPFRYDYLAVEKPCEGDWVTCKCEVIRRQKRGDGQDEVIFVGDGLLSDGCAAANAADTVFATGRLYDYCVENGIEATELVGDFGPVLEYVMKKATANGDQ
jgi:2,3-diketo-5-methylthio-1-phosphopentane phosphatase